MTGPKQNLRFLISAGGLLLIPLVALWLLVSPVQPPGPSGGRSLLPGDGRQPSPDGTKTPVGRTAFGDSPIDLGTPAAPPPRVAAGIPAQAGFTLLAVTLVPRNNSVRLPPPLAPPPGTLPPLGTAAYPFLQGAGSVGLWIGVRGGLGVKTLTIPYDGRRHAYPFGHAVFVAQVGPSENIDQWTALDGRPLMGGAPPYTNWTQRAPSPAGGPAAELVTLVPSPLSSRFRVTAQPLSADGRPTGRPVALVCQPVTATALFAQIPLGYNAATRQFRVTAARADFAPHRPKTQAASWRIAGVPVSTESGTAEPPRTTVRVGPFVLHATAAEAEDTSGDTGSANQHPFRPGGPHPYNIDLHLWTGVPTIRYLLNAHAASPPVPGQSWLFQLERVTPQWRWNGPAPALMPGEDGALALFPLTDSFVRPSSRDWVLQDGEAGVAYPGQQQWLKIEGTALRSGVRTETVTFHDADVVHDAGFGGDRIVWHHPQTQTTASGVSVTVLNGRPGKRDTTDPLPDGQTWWYDRGNAELLLAWRLPPGFESGVRARLNAPHVASLPQGAAPPPGIVTPGIKPPPGAGTLLASWDRLRPDPYGRVVAPPGGGDARPLMQTGYSLLRLSVWSAQTPKRTPLPLPAFLPGRLPTPETLPPYSWREGADILTAVPLPRHLKTLTLRITLREEQERLPIHLVVPVGAALPAEGAPTKKGAHAGAPLRA